MKQVNGRAFCIKTIKVLIKLKKYLSKEQYTRIEEQLQQKNDVILRKTTRTFKPIIVTIAETIRKEDIGQDIAKTLTTNKQLYNELFWLIVDKNRQIGMNEIKNLQHGRVQMERANEQQHTTYASRIQHIHREVTPHGKNSNTCNEPSSRNGHCNIRGYHN